MKHIALVLGKTGVGKSSLINGISNEIRCFVPESTTSGTKEFEEINVSVGEDLYQFLDTPGLLAAGEGEDDKYIDEIKKAVSYYPEFKCILLLLNFQDDKLDGPIIQMLQNYMNIFPVKYFWEHVIIVYTRSYRFNKTHKAKIENRKGIFVKDVNEKDEFKSFRKFMDDKNINYPNSVKEFFVNSERDLEDIDDDSKEQYKNILDKIKELPRMFRDITYSDREELVVVGKPVPQLRILRKLIFYPRYGNQITSSEFTLKEKDSTNKKPVDTIKDSETYFIKRRCRKVKIIKYYETNVYDFDGKRVHGNRNFIREEEA